MLRQLMDTLFSTRHYCLALKAAQVKLRNTGVLSRGVGCPGTPAWQMQNATTARGGAVAGLGRSPVGAVTGWGGRRVGAVTGLVQSPVGGSRVGAVAGASSVRSLRVRKAKSLASDRDLWREPQIVRPERLRTGTCWGWIARPRWLQVLDGLRPRRGPAGGADGGR